MTTKTRKRVFIVTFLAAMALSFIAKQVLIRTVPISELESLFEYPLIGQRMAYLNSFDPAAAYSFGAFLVASPMLILSFYIGILKRNKDQQKLTLPYKSVYSNLLSSAFMAWASYMALFYFPLTDYRGNLNKSHFVFTSDIAPVILTFAMVMLLVSILFFLKSLLRLVENHTTWTPPEL